MDMLWWKVIGVIVAVMSCLISLWIYFAKRTGDIKRDEMNQRSKRIERVVDSYVRLADSRKSTGFDGLIKAGVNTLFSSEEVTDVCLTIFQRGRKNPLGKYEDDLSKVDLLEFFKLAAKKGIYNTTVEDLIKEINGEKTI